MSIRPARRVAFDDNSPATCAINFPIQGGAASVQMVAIRRVRERLVSECMLGLDAYLVASIHDEVILETAQEDAADAAVPLVEEMTAALLEVYPEAQEMGLADLTEAGICRTWAEKP